MNKLLVIGWERNQSMKTCGHFLNLLISLIKWLLVKEQVRSYVIYSITDFCYSFNDHFIFIEIRLMRKFGWVTVTTTLSQLSFDTKEYWTRDLKHLHQWKNRKYLIDTIMISIISHLSIIIFMRNFLSIQFNQQERYSQQVER